MQHCMPTCRQSQAGTPNHTSGHTEAHPSTHHAYPGNPKHTQAIPRIPRHTQAYPGIPKHTQAIPLLYFSKIPCIPSIILGERGVPKSVCASSGSISQFRAHEYHNIAPNFETNTMGPVRGIEAQIFFPPNKLKLNF